MNKLGWLLLIGSMSLHATVLNINPNQGKLVVKFPSNPTTGFQWQVVQFNKNLLTLRSSQFQKNQSSLIGAGGYAIFTFTVNKRKHYPRNTTIKFKYARPWEAVGATTKRVTINFAH